MRVVTWMTNGRTDGRTEAYLYYITVLLLCCIDIYMTRVFIYVVNTCTSSVRCYVFIYLFFIFFFLFWSHKPFITWLFVHVIFFFLFFFFFFFIKELSIYM